MGRDGGRLMIPRAVAFGFFSLIAGYCAADPPFAGTIGIEPTIITGKDPTSFQKLTYVGAEERVMFDRRSKEGWQTHRAHLFMAVFSDGSKIEVQVNPEFSKQDAEVEAARYLPEIGRLPKLLRRDVETVWIHKGLNPFGGGNRNLLIHTEQGEEYAKAGILEETLCHEACHTSLDAQHAKAAPWLDAQAKDGEFISTYARDNPDREDIAESFLPYLALRFKADRLSKDLMEKIGRTIPNRIKYFDSLEIDLHPMVDNRKPSEAKSKNIGNGME
jgi:hypothetical protein